MPDFGAIGDLLGAVDNVLKAVTGLAGSLAGDGFDTVLGSLGEAATDAGGGGAA